MNDSVNHMHLHVKRRGNDKFYNGPEDECPFCGPEHEARAAEVATMIEAYIHSRTGDVLSEYELRRHLREDGAKDAEISHAMRHLKQVTVCNSCRAVITPRNKHMEPCVHSSLAWEDVDR